MANAIIKNQKKGFYMNLEWKYNLKVFLAPNYWSLEKLQLSKEYHECFLTENNVLLPSPMSMEEEQNCVMRIQKGDQIAFSKLIEHNLWLVNFFAKQFEDSGYEMNDLISIGAVGLIEGIRTYKLNKNIQLIEHNSRCILNAISHFLRNSSSQKLKIIFQKDISY